MKACRVKRFLSFQLDLWSSGLSKDSYGALSCSYVVELFRDAPQKFDMDEIRAGLLDEGSKVKERVLKVKHKLLDFSSFPYVKHTGKNLAKWIVSVLARFGLSLSDALMFVPDGASNNINALTMLFVPFEVSCA